jgi:hypothetical protein
MAVRGRKATRSVLALVPSTAVLALTRVDDDDMVLAAMAAGARGYLLKDATADEVIAAVRMVAAGGAVFGSRTASRLLGLGARVARHSVPGIEVIVPAGEELTAREREVLEHLAKLPTTARLRGNWVYPSRPCRTMYRGSLTSSKRPIARRPSYEPEASTLIRDAETTVGLQFAREGKWRTRDSNCLQRSSTCPRSAEQASARSSNRPSRLTSEQARYVLNRASTAWNQANASSISRSTSTMESAVSTVATVPHDRCAAASHQIWLMADCRDCFQASEL